MNFLDDSFEKEFNKFKDNIEKFDTATYVIRANNMLDETIEEFDKLKKSYTEYVNNMTKKYTDKAEQLLLRKISLDVLVNKI